MELKFLEELVKKIGIFAKETNEIVKEVNLAINGYPAPYKLYKGVTGNFGAIQFDVTPKHRSKREVGAVFIQMAKATGKNEYDWDNKITFACGLTDISKILETFRNPPLPDQPPAQIYHDPNAGTERKGESMKSLSISRGKKGGFFFSLLEKSSSRENRISVPLSDGEVIVLRTLLEKACSSILGW